MDKIAQRRNLLNKLHEMANVPAVAAENFFKPELKKVMQTLINTDDTVRSILTGKKIGNGTLEDASSAKDLLKEAKSFINRKEYLSAVSSLGRFHKKMFNVAQLLKNLDIDVNKIHHRFLFDKLPNQHREQLEDLRTRFAGDSGQYFIKVSSIMDFFHNIGTQRGRALSFWEKKYPKVVGKIRQGAVEQLEAAQELLNSTVAILKEMATYRASRNIDNYLRAGKEISASFNRYDTGKNGFRNYYNEVIKPYLDIQTKMEEEQRAQQPQVVPTQTMPSPGVFTEQGPPTIPSPAPTFNQATIPASPLPGVFSPEAVADTQLPSPPKTPTNIGTLPDVTPSDEPEGLKSEKILQDILNKNKKTSSNQLFLNSLIVYANETPTALSSYISRYATRIQHSQPEMALKLFSLVQKISK